MIEPELALAVSPRDWAERLHRFLVDHGGARVRVRVMTADEAVGESYHVFVVDDLASFLTPRLVRQVQASGRKVVGVYDRTDASGGVRRLTELGVDATIASSSGPEEFLRVIGGLGLVETVDQADTPTVGEQPFGFLLPTTTVAVSGPSGGVGATEVAVALAQAWGRGSVLVDADDQAPSLSQRLSLPLHPNLRTAIDAVHHRPGQPLHSTLGTAGRGFRVLAGLANPKDWVQVRPTDVIATLGELALTHRRVIVDVGSQVEDLAYAGGVNRFALARAVLGWAGIVVAVASPSPVGTARLLDWLAEVRTLTASTPVVVVFNRVPRSPFRRQELREELLRSVQPSALHFLPEDREVQRAGWDGVPAAGGPFAKAVIALSRTVSAVVQPVEVA